MKLVLKNIVVSLIFIFGSILFAANHTPVPKLEFKTIYSDTFVLYVAAYDNSVEMKLHNKTGELLFSESLKKGYAYKKTYDISSLSDDTYYAELIDNKVIKLFRIEKGDRNKISEIEKLPFK